MLTRPKTSLRKSLVIAIAGLAILALPGCVAQGSYDPPDDWFADRDTVMPVNNKIYVCHTYGCRRRTIVQFNDQDLGELRAILEVGAASPITERAAVSKAVQWYELRIARDVGNHNDKGGYDASMSGVPGQMDCIDEATNTTSLLMVAQANQMLAHHKVRKPVAKGFFLDGRYPHATAVLVENSGKGTYAIDSYPRGNAEPPVIMDLDAWYASRT